MTVAVGIMAHQPEFRIAQPDDENAIQAFNNRMAQAGSHHSLRLYAFTTLRLEEHTPIVTKQYLYLDAGVVRGGISIKEMTFRLHGKRDEAIAAYHHPVSEGQIDRRHALISVMMHRTLVKKYPLSYALGIGSLQEAIAQLLLKSGWVAHPVPFRFRIIRARPFLRNIVYLRNRSLFLRFVLNFLEITRLGSLGLVGLNTVTTIRRRSQPKLLVEHFEDWEAWADELWNAYRDRYGLIGERSLTTLRALYPNDHPHLNKVRFRSEDGTIVGWAVYSVAQLHNHNYFGSMRLGVIIDTFAAPEMAPAIATALMPVLEQDNADVIVVNHSHRAWQQSFEMAGMLHFPTNFFLLLSPNLAKEYDPLEEHFGTFFFTRGDGDGPINLW